MSVIIFDKMGQLAEISDLGFTGSSSIDRFKIGALEVSAAGDVRHRHDPGPRLSRKSRSME